MTDDPILTSNLPLDATCKAGDSETTVTIGAGDSFTYKTSAGAKYSHNVYCLVNYEMDETCEEMTFSCKKISIKNNKDCSNGDVLVLENEDEEKL